MFNRTKVQSALKKCWALDFNPKWKPENPTVNQDSVTSLMIYDIFGGEILKTPKKKGWHFYNRIEGKRIDFTKSELEKSPVDIRFQDILSTPEETCEYFELEDYSTLRRRFIRVYEEIVGLKRQRYSITT